MMENYFIKLNSIDVSDKTEKKNGLTYLSWAFAWGEIKKIYPDAKYKIYKNIDDWIYHTDGKTGWVETGVTINGIEYIEYLPIMDYRNKSISVENITSFDVNKAIQRSLTKAVARHGLGLYIYAGEDLPEPMEKEYRCADCGKLFEDFTDKNGKVWSAGQVYHMAEKKNPDNKARCFDCRQKYEEVLKNAK